MTITLHPSWTAALLAQPETGMGWQLVEVRTSAGRCLALVADATTASSTEGASAALPPEVAAALEDRVENSKHRVLSQGEVRRAGLLGASSDPYDERDPGSLHGSEYVWRFSRPSDPRIRADGSLAAGTFVADRREVPKRIETAADARRRLAILGDDPPVIRREVRLLHGQLLTWGNAPRIGALPGEGETALLMEDTPPGAVISGEEVPEGY